MRDELERRSWNTAELRAEPPEGGGLPVIVGRAAVFDALSEDLGGFRERVAPGAFAATIAEDDIRALINHSPDYVLGRNRAGTLKLAEDEEGLSVRITPPDTSYARDLAASIGRGDMSGMSFGFRTITDEWNIEDGETVRTLKAVRLFDVSAVTFPAYPRTDVAVRALTAFREALKPPVSWRRNLGRRRLELMEKA